MQALNRDSKITVNRDVVAVEMDGDLVMMDMESGSYFGISGVARFIWECLQETPASTNELVDRVVARYDVDPSECCGDVSLFVADLLARNLASCSS